MNATHQGISRIRQIIFFALFAAISWASPATAENELSWSITPYLWASNTSVDLSFQGDNLGGDDISFNDLLDVLDTAYMVQVEVGRGKWSAFADIAYLDTSETTERDLVTVDARNQQTFIDAAIAYWPSGIDGQLNLFGGVRYTGFDDRYRVSLGDVELGTQRTSNGYYDALLGVRYRFAFSDRWALVTRGDLSFGDSEGTYLLRANFAYLVGKRRQNALLFGYQYKSAEYRDGDARTDFEYMGPMAGFSFRF